MLLAAAQYMYATSQECVFTDCTFSNVALRANVHAFSDSRIPVGQYGQKAYEDVVRGIWAGKPIKRSAKVNAEFSRNQTKRLREGLECAVWVAQKAEEQVKTVKRQRQ